MNSEIWKAIRDFVYYEASNLGRIRSLDRFVDRRDGTKHFVMGRVLRPNDCLKKGYLTVCLYGGDGQVRRRLIHALVLETFVGPCPDGMEGCHGDGDPRNNRLDNLRWDTPAANQQDRKKHGTYYDCGNKLNESQARIVRRLLEQRRLTGPQIAEVFGVCDMTIRRIKRGLTWRGLGGAINGTAINKLSPADDQRIFEMRQQGTKWRDIAHDFHVASRAVVLAERRHKSLSMQ